MNHYKKIFVFLLMFFLLVSVFNNVVVAENKYVLNYQTKEDNIIVTTKHAELYIKKGYISEDEKYTITNKIEKGIRDLKKYLGEYSKYNFKELGKIEYYIKDHHTIKSAAIPSNGRIHLSHVHLQKSPYIHETAHILLDENGEEIPDVWLKEGLPTYLNAKFAQYKTEIIGDNNNLEKRTQEYLQNEENKVILEYFPAPFHRGANERRAYYWLSASFVKFVENKYGKDKLLELYNARRKQAATIDALEDNSSKNNEKTIKNVEEILGTSVEKLKEQWLTSL